MLGIAYGIIHRKALESMVRDILFVIEQNGLPPANEIYLMVNTKAPGVDVPEGLPDISWLVIGHQFWDLLVYDEAFTVELAFGQKVHEVLIPFHAVIALEDKKSGFQLLLGNLQMPSIVNTAGDTNKFDEAKTEDDGETKKERSNILQFKHPEGRHLLANDNVLTSNKVELDIDTAEELELIDEDNLPDDDGPRYA